MENNCHISDLVKAFLNVENGRKTKLNRFVRPNFSVKATRNSKAKECITTKKMTFCYDKKGTSKFSQIRIRLILQEIVEVLVP